LGGGANMGHPIETNGGLFTIGNSHYSAASSQLDEFLVICHTVSVLPLWCKM